MRQSSNDCALRAQWSSWVIGMLLCVAVAQSTLAANNNAGPVHATMASDTLQITGVTPGGKVAIVGVAARTVRGMLSRWTIEEVAGDTDRDGAITYAPKNGLPFRTVVAVVDLDNGSAAVVAPEGFEINQYELARETLKKDAEGALEALELDRIQIELLLVRPGSGAWILHAQEGFIGDADHVRNGKLALRFDDAESLGDGKDKGPKKLKAGDFIAVIDVGRMEVRTLAVTK